MDFDPALVLGMLDGDEVSVLEGWLDELGLGLQDWPHVPPLAVLLPAVAVLRLSALVEGVSETDAVRIAAEELGLEDPGDRDSAHHPADRIGRNLRRWIRAAEERRGQSVRPPSEGAA